MARPGGGKHGLGLIKCQRYRNRGTREMNKELRLKKHLRRFPADDVGATALRALGGKHVTAPAKRELASAYGEGK